MEILKLILLNKYRICSIHRGDFVYMRRTFNRRDNYIREGIFDFISDKFDSAMDKKAKKIKDSGLSKDQFTNKVGDYVSDEYLKRTPFKDYIDTFDYKTYISNDQNNHFYDKVKIVFDMSKVGYEFAQAINPQNKDKKGSLLNYLTSYNKNTKIAEMIFDVDDTEGIKRMYDRVRKKSQEEETEDWLNQTNLDIEGQFTGESMMTPVQRTFTGKRTYQCDEEGIELLKEAYDDYDDEFEYEDDFDEDYYDLIDIKTVYDTDGFTTDYALYHDTSNDTYVCIFGDVSIYNPTNTEPDAEFDTEREAQEWFDSYDTEEELDWDDADITEDDLDWEDDEEEFDDFAESDEDFLIIDDEEETKEESVKPRRLFRVKESVNDKFYKIAEEFAHFYEDVDPFGFEDMLETDETIEDVIPMFAKDFSKPVTLRVAIRQFESDLEDWDLEKDYPEKYAKGMEILKSLKDLAGIKESVNKPIEEKKEILNEEDLDDTDKEIIKIISDVNKETGNLDSDESVIEIEKRLQDNRLSVDADHLGELISKSKEMIDILDESKELDKETEEDTEKVNFKDVHICKGCGKPLSQCTCKAEGEDEDIEECTQPSSVGQHKTASIDLL